MIPVLLLLGAVAPLVVNGQLAQTAATCSPDFAWMGNSKGTSPCQLVASLNALCNNGNWIVPKLDAAHKYNNPLLSNGTATLCTCSWASYNLISACTSCQGFPEQIPFWGAYATDCVGKISESYWPSTITLPTDILIPFWASQDPTKWTNSKFVPAEAKTINAKGQPDLSTTPAPKKKKAPVGAIVGGVIGGVVVIGAFIGLALFMVRKHKQTLQPHDIHTTSFTDSRPPHSRKVSDMTVDSNMKSVGGWTTLTTSTPMHPSNPPYSPTVHTHTPSVSSLPFFSSVVGNGTQSPSPPPQQPLAPRRPEDVVTPFMLPPTNDNPDQKRANGEWPVYDSPNAPPPNPVRMDVTHTQTSSRRGRYNPPAYTESSPGGSASRHRAGQESTDSNHTTPSSSSANIQRGQHTPANSGGSTAHMGLVTPRSPSVSEFGSPQPSVGRSLPGPSRDIKRRPTEEDFHAGDIA